MFQPTEITFMCRENDIRQIDLWLNEVVSTKLKNKLYWRRYFVNPVNIN